MGLMSDRLTLTLLAAFAALMIGFAAIWPQGMGARSPGPFGHTPLLQTPAMRAALARANAKEQEQIADAKAAAEAAKQAAAARIAPLRISPSARPLAAAPKPPAVAGLRPSQ
jgi:hypothetical protein